MNYERDKAQLLEFHGMNLVNPPDQMPPGKYPFAMNVRAYQPKGVIGRATLDSTFIGLPFSVHSIRRLNDSTPAGPVAGYVIIGGAGNFVYCNAAQVDSTFSGNPVSLLPFRPNRSVQPWMYIGDSQKMSKIRSDGTAYKMGIKEPQQAPNVSFIPASDSISLLGPVTVYYFNNPVQAHNQPLQAVYLWHHPSDRGPSNLVETIADANGSNTGNSLLFDDGLNVGGANPVAWGTYQTYVGTVNVNGTAVTWDSGNQFTGLVNGNEIVISGVTYTITGTPTNTSLTITTSGGSQTAANYSAAVLSGTVNLFAPAMESEGYQDFNCSILGTFYVPAGGTYTFSATCKDDFMWGIGNSPDGTASWPGPAGSQTLSTMGQTKTTINAYPLMPRTKEANGNTGNFSTASVQVTFSAPGNYPFEIDWDYWYHAPRGLSVKCNGVNIPPIPPSIITQSQYRYTYRSSATGAVSNPSPESVQSPLSVLSNLVLALFSTDPQVDKIDFYRLDAGLTNFTYVGTISNNPQTTTITPSVTLSGLPQTVRVASNTGFSVGELVNVDTGGNSETTTLVGVGQAGQITVNVVSASVGPGYNQNVLFTVNTNAGISPGDAITVTGNSNSFLNGTFTVLGTPTGPGVFQVLTTPARSTITTQNGTGGTLVDNSTVYPTVTAIFLKNHSAGAILNSLGALFTDNLLDADVASNPILDFDNFEPFPSIDLPRKGTVNVFGVDSGPNAAAVNWASGDQFNTRWLPGTIIVIGTNAFTLVTRPSSPLTLYAQNVDIVNGVETVVTPSIGLNQAYEIAEPILAAQPLPYIWGPTDNVAFIFGCGDPLRPGTLYWTKGNNPDSAPDTNQQDVTSPSEPLMNGCIVGGFGMVFSTERAWIIWPNYFNALATVTGTQGQTWTLQESVSTRGLYMPRALTVDGGGNVYFRAKDGIYKSPGGQGSESITDPDLYNLFPHEGRVPQAVTIAGHTIYPPDDSQPQKQKLSCATGYIYYDYVDKSGTPRTLTFDIAANGWVWDVYATPVTVHGLEEGANVNDTIVGCQDGSVHRMDSTGSEAATAMILMPSWNAGDTRAQKHWGDIYTEMQK